MIPGYQVHYNNAKTGKRGTAIYTKDLLSPRELQIDMTFKTPRDRLTAIIAKEFVIVEAYAPCNCETDQKREDFYNDMVSFGQRLQALLPTHRLVMMGDFNAQI